MNKLNLVLDENIIELAARAQNKEGNEDYTCAILIHEILKRCNIIHCSTELSSKYSHKLKNIEKVKRSASHITKLLMHMSKMGKIQFHGNPPALSCEENIPEDDRFLIRLTVHTKSVLVSADCKLREKLEYSQFLVKYPIQIMHPDEVLIL